MKTVLLSVVMPVHRIDDRCSQIERIVMSISGLPIQLVIVQDNHFFDFNLFEKVEGLNAEQISVVSGKFGNPGAARNFGLRYTTGTWTAFWDSDDSPNIPEFVNMVNFAETKDANVVAGFFEGFDKEIRSKSIYLKFPTVFLRLQILLNPGLWRFAFKTNSIKFIKFPELVMAEDQLFLMKRVQKISDICLYPEIVYRYLTNSPNQVTRQSSNRFKVGEALEYIFNSPPQKKSFFNQFLTVKLAISFFKITHNLTTMKFIVKGLARKKMGA